MTISGVAAHLTPIIQSIVDTRSQLDDLQRQLGTGQKAAVYAGLGTQSDLAVGLSAQLAKIGAFGDAIDTVGTRIQISQSILQQISGIRTTVKGATVQPGFTLDNTGQTMEQKTARNELDQILNGLNTQVGDRYLFSGTAVDQPATDTIDHILDGDGLRAGFKQVVNERNQADLGANGLGRLVIPPAAGGVVSVSEDVAGSPFGFKLALVNSSLTGATVTGPSGSPPDIDVTFASNPNDGDTITFRFNLPDGSTEDLTLQATSSATPAANQFSIGMTPAATAANLQAALTTAVGQLASTSLSAASAVAASNDFFNIDSANPPQRVAGPPFNTATALVAGTPANTVFWYTGEAGSAPARSTATVQVDSSLTVSYGLRANEQGIEWIVRNVATLAATSYSASNPNAADSYAALNQRLNIALAIPNGVQQIDDIAASLASAQSAMKDAQTNQAQTKNTLTDLLQRIEGISSDQVGSEILALQTSLQASLQTTAMLSKLSLANFLT
jgi:flagellar hook-associated protein 3 FlgL